MIIAAPRIRRGRDSGLGPVRINITAITASAMGSSMTADPISVRNVPSIHAPTGRAASNHELAAITTATPRSARAIPSRRCPGSMSWARPTDRAVPPTPLATINQVARAARPTPAPAAATTDGLLRRVAGLVGFFGAFRGAVAACREPAFDLLVLALERAAVLLGMAASLIAYYPICTIRHTSPTWANAPVCRRIVTWRMPTAAPRAAPALRRSGADPSRWWGSEGARRRVCRPHRRRPL